MDSAQLQKLIDKYSIKLTDEGNLTWEGFPNTRELAVIKMNKDQIIGLLS